MEINEIKTEANNLLVELDKLDNYCSGNFNQECKSVDELFIMIKQFLENIIK